MKQFNSLLIYSCLMCFIGLGCSQPPTADETSSFKGNTDRYLQELNAKGNFNGTVLVRQNNKTMYHESFGYANGSNKKLENDFRFGIGSIYKEFPAVAIMQLSEEGKLDIHNNVHSHLSSLPNWSKKITIKHLLQYSSGLPTIDFGKYFSQDIEITESDILSDLMGIEKLEFEPGTDYLYSNNNPFLLIKIIEKVSGLSYSDYAQKQLLMPHGIEGIVFKERYPYTDATKMAIPFNGEHIQDAYKVQFSSMLMCTSAIDLSKWMEALHGFKIIDKSSLHFLSETASFSGRDMQAPLGVCLLKNDQIIEHTHHGSMGNFECLIQSFADENLSIVILTNQKNGNVFDISDDLISLLEQKN